jgi:hypothetical protein
LHKQNCDNIIILMQQNNVNAIATLAATLVALQQTTQNDIFQSFSKEIKDGLASRSHWDKYETRFYTISVIMGIIAGIVAFAAGSVIFASNIGNLTFLAGCCSSAGTGCIIFSRYCDSQCKSSTKKINTLLKSLGITMQLPDLPSEGVESLQSNQPSNLSTNLFTNLSTNLSTNISTTQPVIQTTLQSVQPTTDMKTVIVGSDNV